MYEELDVTGHEAGPPSLFNAVSEIPRTLFEMAGLAAVLPLLGGLQRGDGHPVLVLPGFLAGDESTAVLRRYLNAMGYHSQPWRLGRNTGRPDIMQQLLVQRFLSLSDAAGRRLSIVGQSLGGIFGRELARLHPDRVRQVITLGSPFATRYGGSALSIVRRLFEQNAGMRVEDMRQLLADVHRSPPVPVTAIYSKSDGVVNWRVCRETSEDELTQNIEVIGSHCGMAFNPMVYYVIADRLAQPEDDWQKFESRWQGNRKPTPIRRADRHA